MNVFSHRQLYIAFPAGLNVSELDNSKNWVSLGHLMGQVVLICKLNYQAVLMHVVSLSFNVSKSVHATNSVSHLLVTSGLLCGSGPCVT